MAVDAGTVVVVEDDPNIADLIDLYLRRDGYRVLQASDGATGLKTINRERPRLVILDIGLPGEMNGFEVCRQLRADGEIPVMIVTARDEEIDRVLGFELGADDYIVKPFSPREMAARVKAILRRVEAAPAEKPSILKAGEVGVDIGRREATVGATVVPLATREFDLLAYLMENQGLAPLPPAAARRRLGV